MTGLKLGDKYLIKGALKHPKAPKPFYSEEGILMMSVYDFLLNPESLEI